MKNPKEILILIAILVTATALLTLVNTITQPLIQESKEVTKNSQVYSIFPDAKRTQTVPIYKNATLAGEYLKVLDNANNILGYIIEKEVQGYNPLKIMVALDKNKNVRKVIIIESQETPGIGSRATEPEFLDRFLGLKKGSIDSIDGISGATISSSAIKKAVKESLEDASI